MPSKLTPPLDQHDHVLGPPDALVQLVEFGDYQCPHCGAAYPVLKQLQKTYAEKMLFAFRNFPLANAHEYALSAAIAAEAAGRQHRYWEMHDLIFENQVLLSEEVFAEFARELALNPAVFEKDMQDEALREKVETDFESGVRSGVNGTPTFYMNGHKYTGDYSYKALSAGIDKYIAEKAQY